MRSTRVLLAFAVAAAAAGCSGDTPLASGDDGIVIQAYLYAGEPVRDVRIASTVSIDVDTTAAPGITDATVLLLRDGVRYALSPVPGDSGAYQYGGTDLSVNSGDKFRIEVERNGKLTFAETTVPAAPTGIAISSNALVLPTFEFTPGSPPAFDRDGMQVEVTWSATEGELYYVVVDNVEADTVAIDRGDFGGRGMFGRRFLSQPINRATYAIDGMQLEYLGRHRVRVYRINQEYADLYLGRQQDSRELNEPLTNIVNGLGVFSAFACDSVFFTVTQEE